MNAVKRLLAFRILVMTLMVITVSLFSSNAAQANNNAWSHLRATSGRGFGMFEIAPVESASGPFKAEMLTLLYKTAPNVTFIAYRAPDFTPNGVCTGTNWLFTPGLTFTTNQHGAAVFDFDYTGAFPTGTRLDVRFRFVGSDGTTLESGCMSINH